MIVAVLQARMSSSRLPGKVLADVGGRPMLARMLQRVRAARLLDLTVLATSVSCEDDSIESLCTTQGVPCFRGSLADVLDRVYQAALPYSPDHIVRLTGDCPLIDPKVIDATVAHHLAGGYEYTTNAPPGAETFPDGLDTEVVEASAFARTWRDAVLTSHREHVTLYIKDNPSSFQIGAYPCRGDFSTERWTVDAPGDLEFVRRVFSALDREERSYPFGMWDVLRLLEKNPSLRDLNRGISRNEGMLQSREEDNLAE